MTKNKQNSTDGSILAMAVGKSPGPQAGGDLSTAEPKIFFSAYSPKRKIRITFPAEGRTKQSFKQECDINTIMSRYLKTGLLEHVRQDIAQFIDVTGADFMEAQNLVAGANSMFHSLPSHIRTKFDNNPAEFLKFMENPANAQEAISLGLQAAQAETSHPPSGEVATTQPAASTQAVGASKGGQEVPAPQPAKAV